MRAHVGNAKPEPTVPTTKESKAAKPHQHRMAQEQGSAYQTAATHMLTNVAQTGAEAHVGDMLVAIAVEKAEGMYQMQRGSLYWTESENENAHIEVTVRDAADLRFIPGLDVTFEVFDGNGDSVASGSAPFLWHPWMYHYGANVELPGSGEYAIRVEVAAPQFGRHDKENGQRYGSDVTVEFIGVKITTGKG